jgi:magnesium-transporting ATPase (P-type)
MAVLTVILMQVFYLLNCRSLKDSMFKIGLFSNNTVYAGIVAIIALQAAYIYVPFMQTLFQSAPLTLEAWGISALVAFSVVPIMAVDKWVAQRYTARSVKH